jgi:hypothetical protein
MEEESTGFSLLLLTGGKPFVKEKTEGKPI